MTTTPPVRIVEETLRLDACAPEDVLDIAYSLNGSWRSIGRVVLKRIKPVAKGRVQIKYHDTRAGSKVLKADVDAGLMVKRRRPAVEADGPEAGRIEPQSRTVDGIGYVSTDPTIDIAVSLANARPNAVPMLPGDLIGRIEAMQHGGQPMVDLVGMLEDRDAAVVAIAELLSGQRIWRG